MLISAENNNNNLGFYKIDESCRHFTITNDTYNLSARSNFIMLVTLGRSDFV